MLVVGRRVGERILIGKNVEITILGVQGSKVRIGVDAPSEVGVLRPEARDRQAPTETIYGRPGQSEV